MTTSELIRRAITIKLSRPELFRSIWDARLDWYILGDCPPNYPVPAIPLAVKYDYIGCVNIDDVTDPDDPVIVWMYDSWTGFNPEPALR